MIRKLIICIAVLVGFCPMAWGTVDDVPNPKFILAVGASVAPVPPLESSNAVLNVKLPLTVTLVFVIVNVPAVEYKICGLETLSPAGRK